MVKKYFIIRNWWLLGVWKGRYFSCWGKHFTNHRRLWKSWQWKQCTVVWCWQYWLRLWSAGWCWNCYKGRQMNQITKNETTDSRKTYQQCMCSWMDWGFNGLFEATKWHISGNLVLCRPRTITKKENKSLKQKCINFYFCFHIYFCEVGLCN